MKNLTRRDFMTRTGKATVGAFAISALSCIEDDELIKEHSYIGMVLAERILSYCQCPRVEDLCFGILALDSIVGGKTEKGHRHIGVIWPECSLRNA